jgi:ATP/maltotriose-dependent transcriptional regulator MalT
MEERNKAHPLCHDPAPNGMPQAKLSLPRLAQAVPRPRLFALLDEARSRAAVWVTAPGGAGKTTLAATYIAEHHLPYLWYQLDEHDADPATFFFSLGQALNRPQAPEQEGVHLPLPVPDALADIAGFARRYFRSLFALLAPGAVLVLDNHQRLGELPLFQEILRAAISEVPLRSNLIVISRHDPPPLLARQRAIGSLTVIDWEEMRLTLEEAAAIAARHGRPGTGLVRALHRRSEGWVKGLILLLERMIALDVRQLFGAGALRAVSEYFTRECFNGLSEPTQVFLMKTAPFTTLTPALAAKISGEHRAAELLSHLHRCHLFIQRRDLTEANYQYHDLFREFLLGKGRETYGPEVHREWMRQAARLLIGHQRAEEAVTLFLQAEDWPAAAEVVVTLAPLLRAQGRERILGGWIQQLPAARVDASPWLLFWKGMSQQFINPFAARALLERACAAFAAAGDTMGRVQCVTAIIDIVCILRQSPRSAVRWIDALLTEMDAGPRFPSAGVEAGALAALVGTLTFIRPQDIRLRQYAERLVALLNDGAIGANQRVWMAGHAVYYLSCIRGDLETGSRLLAQTWPLLESPELTAVNKVFWRQQCVLPYIMMGRDQDARESLAPIPDLIKDHELPFLEGGAGLWELLMRLRREGPEAALPLLKRMERRLKSDLYPLDAAWLAFARLLHAAARADCEAALAQGREALARHTGMGMLSIVMEVHCVLAVLQCERGAPDEGLVLLDMLVRNKFGSSAILRHQVRLIRAYAALLGGDRQACHRHLRRALLTADRRPFFGNFFIWVPRRMLSRLCTEALREGMEVEFMRQVIRRLGLLPEETSLDNWPWPVRVYSLGRFYLARDGESHLVETRAQRRLLNLLEVLVALGGSEVQVERITEVLWPDAEGDAAVSAFTTTVSRLRKLIGHDTLIIKRGRVSLDPRRCWADVNALERLLDRGMDVRDPAGLHQLADQIQDLYRGPFLGDEEGIWPRPLRERLQTRLCRFLKHCAASAAGQGWVMNLAARLSANDPGLEAYCRDLAP